ncbi:hypothetical protein K3495_g5110 [Podosphaera aphanis]|nr:hypothetical protein K3495_g5110 [Podosphaera aphanis]
MAITPLPEAAVHLLGSTQALTTPLSLIKELIDNALDAKATSVDILISPNTLDRIEVKDNGHGIPQEDFNSLGKRGHTSKLRSFDELRTIGSVSLGFRGEALFSAVQLGQVSITSKCYGEEVATMAKLQSSGGIDTKTAASHPIGTTVTVTKFLSALPVRKQTSLKEASKTLGKLKELLRAYCLARLHVKFSLKVIKTVKGSWSFSPRSSDGIKEVVSQAIGREVPSYCIEKSLTFSESTAHQANHNNNNQNASISNDTSFVSRKFYIDLYLPHLDADFSKVSHGQYISVDARPVSHEKGTMKKIVTIFKQILKNSAITSTSKITNPFLRLDIKCPRESYDPNIEPAKDDVIFDNEPLILKNIEEAFRDIYESRIESNCPETFSQEVAHDHEHLPIQEQTPGLPENSSVRDALSRKTSFGSTKSLHVSPITSIERSDDEKQAAKKAEHPGISINCDAENLETPIRSKVISRKSLMSIRTPESVHESPDNFPLNPWLIARMSTSKQHENRENNSLSGNRSNSNLLLTPQPSSDSTFTDFRVHSISGRKKAVTRSCRDASLSKAPRQMLLPIPHSSPPIITRQSEDASSDDDFIQPSNNARKSHRNHGFVSARQVIDSPLSSPSESMEPMEPIGPKRQKLINKPFVSPLKEKEILKPESLHQTTLTSKILSPNPDLSRRQKRNEEDGSNLDLIWSMDYEHRKAEATRKRREELRTSQRNEESLFCSPQDNNRHDAAPSSEETSPINSKNLTTNLSSKVKTSLPDNDPRGYFIRRQNSALSRAGMVDGPKITRAKSLRLPLERIPDDQELHHLMIRVKTSLDETRNMVLYCGDSDEYIQRGSARESLVWGLNFNEKKKEKLISAVREMTEKWKENVMLDNDDDDQVEYNFENLITVSSNILS